MGDLRNPKLIWLKGCLFLLLGLLSATVLLLRTGDLVVAVLLCLTVWAFCRSYYFAFYVIEHYVDAGFRFAGLVDFAKYVPGKPRSQKPATRDGQGYHE
ncbi:hypothetical protein GC176_16800 [bacterium]|nr:hypothetical protein [bacterium]